MWYNRGALLFIALESKGKVMRYSFLLISTFVTCISFSAVMAQDGMGPRFFDSLYDIPLMPKMEEVPEMALSFDKPDGRISQAGGLVKQSSLQEIMSFYDRSLEQMGWYKKAQGQYAREGDKLDIFVEKSNTYYLVSFSLSPN